MANRELYKACRYQVRPECNESGMTLAEIWEAVHSRGPNAKHGPFWYDITMAEYKDSIYNAGEFIGPRTSAVLNTYYG